MDYAARIALRYLGSKKRDSISVGTLFAILGVALGVAALVSVMSVTGGFRAQFQEKVLGVNAHVLVLKYSTNFTEYRAVMATSEKLDGVVGVAPFSINPMMLTHKDATATGVLLKGVDPLLSLGVPSPGQEPLAPGRQPVLDVPKQIVKGSLEGLRIPGAKPEERKSLPQESVVREPVDAGLPDIDQIIQRPFTEDQVRFLQEAAGFDAGRIDAGLADGGSGSGADGGGGPTVVGSVEPDGGYQSVLPDDDVLPFVTDECDDQAKVAELPGILMGVSLAKVLGADIGSCVTVTSPTIGFSYSGGSIRPPVAKRFRVLALFEAGFDQYDSKLVYVDLYQAQAWYDHGDTVTGVEMRLADVDQAKRVGAQVDEALGKGAYNIMDWEELNRGLFTALKIQQYLMSGVLALIVVVAAFTVIATLIMVVLDKKKEIAVLKAMGARDDAILRIFLYQGGIIGLGGTGLGLALGFAVCKGLLVYGFPLDPKVYFISRLPVQVRPFEFLLTGAIAIAICLVATIVPSLYAAWVRPADGFREH